jgi:LysR family transcriptional regulator, transcriptional activator of nodD3 and syrA
MLYIDDMNNLHEGGLAGLDLNLLVVLDALLAERHVTRAARRVGLTQPACSHALGRLRRALGDPLLVRGPGGAMVTTPRAEALAPGLRAALAELATAVAGPPSFDPATARRSVRIATSDYAELVVLPALIAALGRDAPGVDVWVVPLPTTRYAQLAMLASGAADLVIGPPRRDGPAGIYERRLFDERFRCVVRRGHPAGGRRLTLARYCALSHVMVAPRGTAGSVVDDALAARGRRRRVAVAVPHFLVVPHLVAASDLVATLAGRVVDAYADTAGLVVMAPPIELPGFAIAMTWHERLHRDPAQRWLRDQVARASGAPGQRAA